MAKNVKEAAIIAAKWWTELLAKPNPNNFNNGDRTSDVSLLLMMLGTMRAMDKPATPEQLENFNNLLAESISKELDSKDELFIDTDYGPCDILGDAAVKAGINTSIFPFKRMMWISEDKVVARDGLDASDVTLYHIASES